MSADRGTRRVRAVAIGSLFAALLSSCMMQGGAPIARVSNAQGEAYIIRAGSNAPTPAVPGELLYPGDGFTTRAGTMELTPTSGGTVDVYPNTDPIIEQSFCFAVRLFKHGGMHVNGHDICVNETLTASDVGYEFVQPGVMRVWVLEGQVRLLTPPFGIITTGQRAEIQNGVIVSRSTFTPAEFARRFPPVAGAVPQSGPIPPVRRPPRRPPPPPAPPPPPPQGPEVGR